MRPGLAFAIGVAAAACGGGKSTPPPAQPVAFMAHVQPHHRVDTRCELTPEAVLCHSTNLGNDYTVECVEPFVVVKETGDILNGSRKWCSKAIAPGTTDTYAALEGFRPLTECGPDLAHCEVMFLEDDDAKFEHLAALARAAEATAIRPGKQPTWSACDETRRAWLANPVLAEKYQSLHLEEPDLIGVFCKLHLSPAEVACFGKAKTEADVEACTPDR